MATYDIVIIDASKAKYISEHQEMYPDGFELDKKEFARVLSSTDYHWGIFDGGELVAWLLCADESPESGFMVYMYDLSVLPQYQGQGLGKALMAHAYKSLRTDQKWIRMHCRMTSYPTKKVFSGYGVIHDRFLPHWYLEETGVDEDAHELILAPYEA